MTPHPDSLACVGGDLWSNVDSLNYMTAKAQAANEPLLAMMFAAARQSAVINVHRSRRAKPQPQPRPAKRAIIHAAPIVDEPISFEAVESDESATAHLEIECVVQASALEPQISDIDSAALSEVAETDAVTITSDTSQSLIAPQPVVSDMADEFDDALTGNADADAPTIDMADMLETHQPQLAGRVVGVLMVMIFMGYLSAGLAGYINLPQISSASTGQTVQAPMTDIQPAPNQLVAEVPPEPIAIDPQEEALIPPAIVSHDDGHGDDEALDNLPGKSDLASSTDIQPIDESVFSFHDNEAPNNFTPVPTLFGKEDETLDQVSVNREAKQYADQVKRWIASNSDQQQASVEMAGGDIQNQFTQMPPCPQWIVQMVEQALNSPGNVLSMVEPSPQQP